VKAQNPKEKFPGKVPLVALLVLFMFGCSTKVTPVGVGQQAAIYVARKEGAKHSELIYNVDQTITEVQLYLWHTFRESLLPYTPPAPPLELGSPHTKKKEKVPPDSPSPDQLLYQEAMALLKRGELTQAFQKFTLLAILYPPSNLADNALYWAGECCYAQNMTGEALHFFQRVVREYPMGNKVPDAMLKMAYIYLHRGEKEKGLKILRELAHGYPQNPVGQKAQARLMREEKELAYY